MFSYSLILWTFGLGRESNIFSWFVSYSYFYYDIIFQNNQEAKNTAALKSQIDKLQQERDEFQKMVIGNQVQISLFPFQI